MRAIGCVAAVVIALSTGSCQSTQPTPSPSASPSLVTPSPVPSQAPSSTIFEQLPLTGTAPRAPSIRCGSGTNPYDPMALVKLRTGEVVLRDYANSSNPRSMCTFVGASVIRLINQTEVLIGSSSPQVFGVADGVHVRWFQLPDPHASLVGVAPSLHQVAWMTQDLTAGKDIIHVTNSSFVDKEVVQLPNPHHAVTCDPATSKLAAYGGPAGEYLFVLDQPSRSLNSLVVIKPDLTVALAQVAQPGGWDVGAEPSMAFWYYQQLFYWQDGKRWLWMDHGDASVLATRVSITTYLHPTISFTGRLEAYAVLRPDGLHDVVVEYPDSRAGVVARARTYPILLSDTLLWFRQDFRGDCSPGTGRAIIFDLTNSTEYPSAVDYVYSIWPAGTSTA